jgi:Undecaprenyl-phosphate galactose phosphotransferase WbaP
VRVRSFPTCLALLATDALGLALCAALSWWLKSLANPILPIDMYVHALPLLLAGGAAVYTSLGLYPGIGWGPAEELRRVSIGTTVVVVGAIGLTFLGQSGEAWSRQVFVTTWLSALVALPLLRAGVRRCFCRSSWWGVPVVVLGAGATGQQVVTLLRSQPWLGLRPVTVLDDDGAKLGLDVGGVRVAGTLADVPRMYGDGIRHAILAMPCLPASRLAGMLDHLGDHLRHVFIAPALPGSPDVIAETREFANTLVLEVRQNLLRPDVRIIKRCVDVISVVTGLLLCWWIFAGIALAVKLSSVFYGQRRIGRGGRDFVAWKFRSMVKDADSILAGYLAAHPELQAEWERDHKLKDDPRVTWIGRLLRRTSLDELPQLWNVMVGEMSLVGPRPIVQEEVPKYGERFSLYQKVRPGLSGLWQVSGRNDTTYGERVALDCYYVRNWSVWLDLVILARTVRVVLLGKGAY